MSQKGLEPFRKGGAAATEYPAILATKPTAIESSYMVADLLANKDGVYADSLRGKNFTFEIVGLSSIQLVSLTTLLRKRYNKKIKIESLRRQAMSVCDVEDLVLKGKKSANNSIQAQNLIDDLIKLKPKLPFRSLTEKDSFSYINNRVLGQLNPAMSFTQPSN